MPVPATTISQQHLIDAAKAPILAFNEKNWDALRALVTSDFVYDEVATDRRAQGPDEVIPLWQSWATAFPDARATFHNAFAGDSMVVLEVSWKGTHKGPFQMPEASIPATGKPIDIRACFVVEMAGEKSQRERHYFDMATMMQQLGRTA